MRLPVEFGPLVLTMHEAPAYARRAFEAGASGYVTKRERAEWLLTAIRWSILRAAKYWGSAWLYVAMPASPRDVNKCRRR